MPSLAPASQMWDLAALLLDSKLNAVSLGFILLVWQNNKFEEVFFKIDTKNYYLLNPEKRKLVATLMHS